MLAPELQVKGDYGENPKYLAVKYISKICETSIKSCHDLASLGGGKILSQVAGSITNQRAHPNFKHALARSVTISRAGAVLEGIVHLIHKHQVLRSHVGALRQHCGY